jgi:ADP-heptose:LPS heptosyltransferase
MEKGNANLHFLDRYLGIPLVLFLGFFRVLKKRIPVAFEPKRIAILNISSIGDNVLMSAPLQDLKNRFPNAEIVLFCGDTNFGVTKMLPGIASTHKLPVTKVLESIKYIRKEGQFDLLIDFGPWPRLNAIYAAFFRSKCKIGFRSIGQWRHFVYDYAIIHSDQKHELDNFRALLDPLQLSSNARPRLDIPSGSLELDAQEYVIFHPWPGGYKSYMKEWPESNWLELAEKLSAFGLKIYITGAKDDVVNSQKMEQKSNGLLYSLAGKYNLSDTAKLVQNARLIVAVNTGIMHMAAALGVKMVALHGPTSVLRWGPVSDQALNVFPQNAQCGYLHFGYEYHKSEVNCMDLIKVDEVTEAAIQQLGKR